jgi:MEDS: MEthanogen/methylotroph, DcmR Sensory domain/Histidine kinase-like ATPase domain
VRVGPGSIIGPRSHIVQFYVQEAELLQGAGDYLAQALADGGVAVVAATAEHYRAFEAHLARSGADVRAARRAGTLVTIDAGEALRTFVTAGQVDRARFDEVIGRTVREAAASGRPVRVYGEMVALLWEAGHVNAALELETLWNRLSAELSFALYCAYPERPAAGGVHPDPRRDVCQQHTAVLSVRPEPGPYDSRAGNVEVTRTFPRTVRAPREARHFLAGLLAQWRDERLAGDAALVVTELASNAVVHARSGFTVGLAVNGSGIRITVSDSAPVPGGQRDPALPARRGHGLGVVAAVAAGWGVRPTSAGKAVWADFCLG